MGKYSDHSSYVNKYGEEIPSATTVIKLLHKSSLDGWIWWLGHQGVKQKDVLNESASFGTHVHEAIEAFIMGKRYSPIFGYKGERERLVMALDKFITWKDNHSLEPIFMEKKFESDTFGGTVDMYAILDGKKTICDFKTSKGFYSTMWLQLAAYWILMEKEGYEIDQVCVIRVNERECVHKIMKLDEIKELKDNFLKLVDFYIVWHKFNKGKF